MAFAGAGNGFDGPQSCPHMVFSYDLPLTKTEIFIPNSIDWVFNHSCVCKLQLLQLAVPPGEGGYSACGDEKVHKAKQEKYFCCAK